MAPVSQIAGVSGRVCTERNYALTFPVNRKSGRPPPPTSFSPPLSAARGGGGREGRGNGNREPESRKGRSARRKEGRALFLVLHTACVGVRAAPRWLSGGGRPFSLSALITTARSPSLLPSQQTSGIHLAPSSGRVESEGAALSLLFRREGSSGSRRNTVAVVSGTLLFALLLSVCAGVRLRPILSLSLPFHASNRIGGVEKEKRREEKEDQTGATVSA